MYKFKRIKLTMLKVKTGSKIILLVWMITGMFITIPIEGQSIKQGSSGERIIHVNYNKVQGEFNTMFKECVGSGHAKLGLRADWQHELATVKKACGFKYIRMHSLLSDDMGVYKIGRKGQPEYNYQYIDELYDYLLSIGIKPFVELSFMPSALASGHQTIFWYRANVTPPKSYKRWADLIRHLVLHFTQRYGANEVKKWYFEVWNEPNLHGFWAGTQADYFKLYKYTAEAIKSVNKDYQVGGPATAGGAWIPEMINYCYKNHVPLDFISTHAYGVKQGFLDQYGNRGTVLSKDPLSVSGNIIRSRKEISESPMPHLKLFYTEWSSSYTPADPLHDSYQEAPYILEKIKQTGNAANAMSYWTFSDIFEEAGPRFRPFHGGFGLMNYEGIKKPAFYAYAYLNKLGNTELVDKDSSSWACKDSKGDVQVLLWNYTYTLPDSTNDQQYYIRNLPAKTIGKVKIHLTHVPAGTFSLEICKIGYDVNDAYTTYLEMGKPRQLTRPEVEAIKNIDNGAPIRKEIVKVPKNGKFTQLLNMQENDVYLIMLNKLN